MEYRMRNTGQPDEESETVEEVREKLRDYYGTAMTGGFPAAVIDLGRVDTMDDDETIKEAGKTGILRQ